MSNNPSEKWAEGWMNIFPKEDIQMASRWKDTHCSWIIMEVQIKTTRSISPPCCQNGSHQIDSKEQVLVRVWGQWGPLDTAGGRRGLVQPLWKAVRRVLSKWKAELSYSPGVPHAPLSMFITALLAEVKDTDAPKCPSVMDAGDVVYVHRISLSTERDQKSWHSQQRGWTRGYYP